MKVLKFGGTSVGSVESMSSVKQIVESCHEPVIVVVSALGGITDRLIETARVAVVGGDGYESHFRAIVERHKTMVQQAVEPAKQLELLALIDPLLGELGNIFRGVSLIKDLSTKTLDTIVSYGERLSSLIVSRVIEGAVHYDARFFIKTSRQYGKHIVDFDETNKLVKRYFAELPRVAVVPGFIASDRITGDVTNLGRGGSDYTASILATALGASQLEIWTDVDGFMTADPRVINTAYVIERRRSSTRPLSIRYFTRISLSSSRIRSTRRPPVPSSRPTIRTSRGRPSKASRRSTTPASSPSRAWAWWG